MNNQNEVRPRYRNIGNPYFGTYNKVIPFSLFLVAYMSLVYTNFHKVTLLSCFMGVYYTGYHLIGDYIQVAMGAIEETRPQVNYVTNDEAEDETTDQAKRDLKALQQLNEFANKINEANIARRNAALQDDELPPLVPMDDSYFYKNDTGPQLRQRGQFAPSMDEGIAI